MPETAESSADGPLKESIPGWRTWPWLVLGWPWRRKRWAWLLALLFLLPWVYIKLFTPAPGQVHLPELEGVENYAVYVVEQGYHCAIIVEQPRVWRLGPPGRENARYVEYAWGDRGFYYESNFWPHSLFSAALMPSSSVVYVSGHQSAPEQVYARYNVFRQDIDANTLGRLVLQLEQSFERDEEGSRATLLADTGEYPGRFYPSHGYYIFWNDCNHWVVETLEAAGFEVSPTLVFTSGQATDRLAGFEQVCQAPGTDPVAPGQ